MKSLRAVLAVWLFCISMAGVVGAQGDFYLKDGDRVVFYGDSITEQRLCNGRRHSPSSAIMICSCRSRSRTRQTLPAS